ncbi:MAG: molybdopterin-dependent oxidoreductase [Acidimicrobiales bacterium]
MWCSEAGSRASLIGPCARSPFATAPAHLVPARHRPLPDLLGRRLLARAHPGRLPPPADGLVDRPLTLTYDQLTAELRSGPCKDFQCVTGWRVEDVPWKGVRLADVLDRAGVQEPATAIRLYSFDGVYTESLTLGQARADDVLVAYEMEDKPVTTPHGGPVRLYVAQMYGYKSLKWLDRIEVTDELVPGYWEELGYDIDAFVGRSNGRNDKPVR